MQANRTARVLLEGRLIRVGRRDVCEQVVQYLKYPDPFRNAASILEGFAARVVGFKVKAGLVVAGMSSASETNKCGAVCGRQRAAFSHLHNENAAHNNG